MSNYRIPTFTGKIFDLLEPTIDMICIEDIAHHLSIENRYCGATKFPYSVGYHSLLTSYNCPNELKLEGLLHDASETWYKDLPKPWKEVIKRDLGTNLWSKTIDWVDTLISEIFRLSCGINDWQLIKTIELNIAASEIEQLLVPNSNMVWWNGYKEAIPYNNLVIQNLSAQNVEELFLKEYNKWRRN